MFKITIKIKINFLKMPHQTLNLKKVFLVKKNNVPTITRLLTSNL